jgi:hypothetical protein
MQWYYDYIVYEGRAGVTWILIAFVTTFLITRGITRKIRREARARERAIAEGRLSPDDAVAGGVIKDIHIGGVHIHHQVWGMLLLLTMGILQFAYEFGSPWLEIFGALFGVGAALVLDEFALFLHLDDVYWSAEGQKSVDAVVATVCVLTALVLGTGPLGVAPGDIDDAPLAVPVAIAINMAFVVITLLKGKVMMAAIGIFVPIVTLVGAIRLARTPSWWSRNMYRRRPRRMARALGREERLQARVERVRVSLGGEPDPDSGGAPGSAAT